MKKILLLLTTLVVLIGCSQSSSSNQISNQDDVLVQVADKTITKGDVYTMMRHQQISSDIIDIAKGLLIDSKVEVNDEIKTKAQQALADQKKQLGEIFKMYYGELSDQELIDKYFLNNAKQTVFMESYFDKNKDTIVQENQPVKLTYFVFDTNEKAAEAIKRINAKEDIEKVVKALGTPNANFNFKPEVLSKNSLPAIVSEFLASDEGKQLAWSKSPLADATTQKYLIVKGEELDSSKLIDEYKEVFSKEQASVDKVFAEAFKENNFEVYDQAIYEAIKNDENLANFKPNN